MLFYAFSVYGAQEAPKKNKITKANYAKLPHLILSEYKKSGVAGKEEISRLEEFLAEDAKFVSGNAAAGTRARKALGELGKSVKMRRNEITAEKNSRKEAKAAK